MSKRGRGSCPNCNAAYFNRSKPPQCGMCGHALGGTFEPSSKKMKYSPQAVEVCESIFSVKTSTKDDRCFVTTDGTMWFCSVEACKIVRSVSHQSSRLANFSCRHVDEAKDCTKTPPVAILKPDLDKFVGSESLKSSLQSILNSAACMQNCVIQVSDRMFCVLGQTSASNPLGYCHVRKGTKDCDYVCTGKDCRGFAAKGKQVRTKSMCTHIALLRSCFVATSKDVISSAGESSTVVASTDDAADKTSQRSSTLTLAERVKVLPYVLPSELLHSIAKRDASTLLGVGEGWPNSFKPDFGKCQLCGSELGDCRTHPGQSQDNTCYLITELNPFKEVNIMVKICSSRVCSAMHQASVEKLGLFNVSDKVLVSLDILLEFREFFKKGQPIGNIIHAKLQTLKAKCKENSVPTDGEMAYIEDLLYNGFYSFEMVTERNLDDVVCGICGVYPEICLGDGNEKNSCTNRQVNYTKDDEDRKDMVPLQEFLKKLRRRWLEKTVYTRSNDKFSVAIEELPPIIAPSLTGTAINTETKKKSVYLKSHQPTGDPALLHKFISEGKVDMDVLKECDATFINDIALACGIPITGKSKQYLCGVLHDLYGSILIGNCPCHGFGKVPGHTGGFYHLLCRHGATVASKFLALTESVRDAADLYLSLKHPPVVFINDTPCGFVRHLECRDPKTAEKLWGMNAGCFEKPELGRKPKENQNVPAIVPPEYSDGTVRPSWEFLREDGASHSQDEMNHAMSQCHFVLGDRFHSASEPHKSPLCEYHNIDLCIQAPTIKTSIQESQNHRKNLRRLRSSCMQSFEVHIAYNFLMDFYQNEEIVCRQKKTLEKSLGMGEKLTRDSNLRFIIQ
ncbi:HMG domain-containing protein 3-like [Dendronephthya gigantea]|uniref:HMG domain-containing protein 3-like n=1 Tax=Dendronephthya gigantea TaxID=151771 RepID=UPI00106AD714|nr:HMG domain-containing protein 3-like [Dendronephthya gigantea]